jgi:hypothetical protein
LEGGEEGAMVVSGV